MGLNNSTFVADCGLMQLAVSNKLSPEYRNEK